MNGRVERHLHGPRWLRGFLAAVSILGALPVAATGCAGEVGPPNNLPTSLQSTAVGPDDLIGVDVVGEKDLSHDYQVHPDGSIDFEHGVKVEGLEPQEIAQTLKKHLVDDRILADPQISIIVKQYNSRKILVIGSVAKPDSITWAPGMTLVGAISLCGWFTPLADKGHVTIIRRVAKDKSVQAVVSVEAITRHAQEDIRLQPGDTINISQNVF
jgi:protein involved in polysaccharide export with SLBB domain